MTEFSSQHHPDALPIGTALGDFAITGLIGEGGFGIVYLAYEATLDRTVAIKEYLPVTIAGRTAELTVAVRSQNNRDAYVAGLQSFLREARLQARFSHPAMLEVYRVWEQNGTAYMAMRYYPGDTLRNLRKAATSSHVFDEMAIQRIMMPVFDALGELHSESVLHRDVSPDNILIMPTGQPVLLDFGAARSVVAGAAQSLTTVLKPGYAPIEQYADDGTMEQGPWTDVYGLGAVLYFLAMGTPPPQAVTRLMGDSLRGFEDSASALYSPTFIDAVKRALAVRPQGRLQSVAALREALGWSWVRTSESLPTTFIVASDAAASAGMVGGESTAAPKSFAKGGDRSVVAASTVPTQAKTADREANASGANVGNAAYTRVAGPSSSKPRTGLIVGVVLVVLGAIASAFLFKSAAPNAVPPSSVNSPATSASPVPAVVPTEPKAASPAAQTVGAPPGPAPSLSTPMPADAKPAVSPVSTATEKTHTKPVSPPVAKSAGPAAATVEPTEPAPRAVTPPQSPKSARSERTPIDPVEPSDSGYDADVPSKARAVGKTTSDVCERLLAKLSLGTDELTSTERSQLRTCR